MVLEYFCPICDEEYAAGDDIFITRCGHVFHKKCLFTWLVDNNTCPDCRTGCSGNNTFKVFIKYRDSQYVDEMIKLMNNNEDEIQNLRAQLHDNDKTNEIIEDLETKLKEKSLELEAFNLKLEKAKKILFFKPNGEEKNEKDERENLETKTLGWENDLQNPSLKILKNMDLKVKILDGISIAGTTIFGTQLNKSNFSAINELHNLKHATKTVNSCAGAASARTIDPIFKDLNIQVNKNNSSPSGALRQINSSIFNLRPSSGFISEGQQTLDQFFNNNKKSDTRCNSTPRKEIPSITIPKSAKADSAIKLNVKDFNILTNLSDSDFSGDTTECGAGAVPKNSAKADQTQAAVAKTMEANFKSLSIKSSQSDASPFGNCDSLTEAKQNTDDDIAGALPKLTTSAVPSHAAGVETKVSIFQNFDFQPSKSNSQPLDKLRSVDKADKTDSGASSGAGAVPKYSPRVDSSHIGVFSTMDSNLNDLNVQRGTSLSNNSDKAHCVFGAIPKHSVKPNPAQENPIRENYFSQLCELHTQFGDNKSKKADKNAECDAGAGAVPKNSEKADQTQAADVKTMEANFKSLNIKSSQSDASPFGKCEILTEVKQNTDDVAGAIPKLTSNAVPSHAAGVETLVSIFQNFDFQPSKSNSQPLDKLRSVDKADKTDSAAGSGANSGAGAVPKYSPRVDSTLTGIFSTIDSNLKDLHVERGTIFSNNSDKAHCVFGAISKHSVKPNPTHTPGFKITEPHIKNFNFQTGKSNANPFGELHTLAEVNKSGGGNTGAVPKPAKSEGPTDVAAVKTTVPHIENFNFKTSKCNSDAVCHLNDFSKIFEYGDVPNKFQRNDRRFVKARRHGIGVDQPISNAGLKTMKPKPIFHPKINPTNKN